MIQIVTLKSSPPETGFSSPGSSSYPIEQAGGRTSFQEYLERLDSHKLDSPKLGNPKFDRSELEASKEPGQRADKTWAEERLDSSKDEKSGVKVENEKRHCSEEAHKQGDKSGERLEKRSQGADAAKDKTKPLDESEKTSPHTVSDEELKGLKGDKAAKGEEIDGMETGKRGASFSEEEQKLAEEEASVLKNGATGKEQEAKTKETGMQLLEKGELEQQHEKAESTEDAALSATLDGRISQERTDANRETGTKQREKSSTRESELVSTQITEKNNKRNGTELQLIDLRNKKKASTPPGEEQKSGKAGDKQSGSFLDGIRGGLSAREKGNGAGELSLIEQGGKSNPASMEQGDPKGDVRLIHIDGGSVKEGTSGSPNDNSATLKDAAASLGKRFDQDVSGKVVKQASIILKDNNRGEIRLVLHPEKLGKVRIQLQLEDNRIAGRIFVDNTSVRDLFESNVKNLAKAFAEEGFDQTKLDVFVGSRDSGKRKEGNGEASSRFDFGNSQLAADRLETSVPLMNQYRSGDTIIDLVV